MTKVRPILMGVETEYAIANRTDPDDAVRPAELAVRLLEEIRAGGPALEGGPGIFLANGGHLYVDCGGHPEFATPECTDPWELVTYVRAGERLLARAVADIWGGHRPGGEVHLFRSNVDYTRPGTTWGCHESYLHRSHPGFMAKHLIPHLVSRVIYTGAGGFTPGRGRFTMSPRAWTLNQVASGSSTGERGIFHTRDEPLAGGSWKRLHLICGESLGSDVGTVLKLGTTALVVAAIDAGHRLANDGQRRATRKGCLGGESVHLENPIGALRRFASDPACAAGSRLASGGRATALRIQRHYHEGVERCRARGIFPPWADHVCRLWARTLDLLEHGDPELARTLDWAIKLALLRRWRGEEAGDGLFVGRLPLATETSEERSRLMEADVRFSQLGGDGILDRLEREGHLGHRLVEPAAVEWALDHPPRGSRARVRGRMVRELGRRPDRGRYACGWTCLHDRCTGRMVDLSEPFETRATWVRPETATREPAAGATAGARAGDAPGPSNLTDERDWRAWAAGGLYSILE